MSIYAPQPALSPVEKRILRVLAEALLDMPADWRASNLPSGQVPLSDRAAADLLPLLEDYVASKKFLERTEFVELMGSEGSSRRTREIYLQGRSAAGRTRVAASWQWGDFQLRLGIGRDIVRGSSARYMHFSHFLRMEERLLAELQLHPRVKALVIQMVVDRKPEIEGIRDGRMSIRRGSVRDVPKPVMEELRHTKPDGGHMLPLGKVIALTTLTADLSVMFTTRDWGVAGTLSAMAAAAPPLLRS
ncbi:MAG TPA: hypothetical protein VF759_03530 [Allosphingosinicella sp.]|jgi:hypothetical protein